MNIRPHPTGAPLLNVLGCTNQCRIVRRLRYLPFSKGRLVAYGMQCTLNVIQDVPSVSPEQKAARIVNLNLWNLHCLRQATNRYRRSTKLRPLFEYQTNGPSQPSGDLLQAL